MYLQCSRDLNQNSTILSGFAIIAPVVKVTNQIKFTSSQPTKTAVFLETRTEVQSNEIPSMDLFCKSTVPYQYLQCNSYHLSNVSTSLPKSQFMRIKRICSYLKNYDKHAAQFTEHFCRRGYSESILLVIGENVGNMSRKELPTYRKKPNRVTQWAEGSNRPPLYLIPLLHPPTFEILLLAQ